MTNLEILKGAKALIDTSEKWTKGTNARNAAGNPVDAEDSGATCRCALGAIKATTRTDYFEVLDLLVELVPTAQRSSGSWTLTLFNDHKNTTHKMVMDLFDVAIKAETK